MGSLRASPNQALLDGETKNMQALRRKQKGKEKKNIEFEPEDEFDPSDEVSGSAKKAWFSEALRDLIYISLSYSWIRDYVKASRDVIH